jgi:peptidoglycan-associated lipoprotein
MKNSFLFVVGTALVLAVASGCKSPTRTTPLPGAAGPTDDASTSGNAGRTTPNLNTSPIGASTTPSGSGVTGSTLGTGELPDDAKLDGRDQDRTKFSADIVYFDFDRSNVRSSDVSKIQNVASAFKSLPPGHDLLVEGHCDERGTEGYNQALGERRALAVRELLIGAGVDAGHVFTKSLGKDQPADPGHTESAYSKNRRGEFILVLPKKNTTTQTP